MKSDDELKRLNAKARDESLKDKDEEAEKQMKRQVARLLRIVGPALAPISGGTKTSVDQPPPVRGPRHKPEPIETKEPPTYIKIVGDPGEEIKFYGGQRRYVRVETDANSTYHDPDNQKRSNINVVVSDDLKVFGTSPLRGGRMRIGVLQNQRSRWARQVVSVWSLQRPPTLSDERDYRIVEIPSLKRATKERPGL